MAEYYAVERSPEYLMHFGVRGMKWGIRKAINKTGRPRSKAYADAQKKLKRATMFGGVIGGAIYASRHKEELNKSFQKSKSKNNMHIARSHASKGKVSSRDKAALDSLKKSVNRGAIAGTLTVGGGLGGGAVGAIRQMRKNPEEYRRAQKAFKKMNFKQRMKYVWSNS